MSAIGRLRGALLAAVAAILSGCGYLAALHTEDWEEKAEQITRVDQHSSYPAMRRPYFEQVNLVEMIDPHAEAKTRYPERWAEAESKSDRDKMKWGIKYDLVLANFRESEESPEQKQLHRNSVQDHILAVATSRCNVFKTYLRRQQSDTNFLLGSAATVAGVLGAILPGIRASKNLAGTAGIFSGIEAEYNQQYFSNLAAQVIVQGIETRQNRMLQELMKDRQNLPVADYSMEAAIKDAVLFDGSCSTVTGLSEASDAVREVTNPGLPRAAEIIAGARALRDITQTENISAMAESGELQKLMKLAAPTSSPLVVSIAKTSTSAITDQLVSASHAEARVKAAIETAAAGLKRTYADAQKKLPEDQRNTPLEGDAIAAKFTEKVTKVLDPPNLVKKCVAALTEPAAVVGAATAKEAVTAEGTPERLEATVAVNKAKADATLAVGRVELLVNAATTVLQGAMAKWLPAVTTVKKSDGLTSFDAIQVPQLPANLAQLCATEAKGAASPRT